MGASLEPQKEDCKKNIGAHVLLGAYRDHLDPRLASFCSLDVHLVAFQGSI